MLEEIKIGRRVADHKECWVNWGFFKRTDDGSASEHDLKDEAQEETRFGYYYNGPGRSFGDHPSFKINKHHVLIVQDCAFDI